MNYSGLRHSLYTFELTAGAGRFKTSRQSGGTTRDNTGFIPNLEPPLCNRLLRLLGREATVARIPKP